jgi:hypothetical protein
MEEGDTSARGQEVDRHTVGNRHGQQDARRQGDPAIDPLDVDPSPTGIEVGDFNPVHLIAQSDCPKAGHRAAERQPPTHHLADGLLAPEAEIEITTGDAGGYVMPLIPTGNLKSRNGAGDRYFPDL